MPGEAVFGVVLRFLGHIFFDIIFELLIQGTGHFVLRTFRPNREPGEFSSTAAGLVVWVLIFWAGYAAFGNLRAAG